MVGYGHLNTPINVKEGSGSKSLLCITEPDDEYYCPLFKSLATI